MIGGGLRSLTGNDLSAARHAAGGAARNTRTKRTAMSSAAVIDLQQSAAVNSYNAFQYRTARQLRPTIRLYVGVSGIVDSMIQGAEFVYAGFQPSLHRAERAALTPICRCANLIVRTFTAAGNKNNRTATQGSTDGLHSLRTCLLPSFQVI